jgi:hypothetical protein
MNALKLFPALCAFSLLVGPIFAETAEARMRLHRRHFYDRHRYEARRQRASPRIEDFQRERQDRRGSEWDSSCFSLPYLPAQYSCSARGGDGT